MARTSPVFICSACQGETLKWQGQCPGCDQWNTLEQRTLSRLKATTSPLAAVPRPLDSTLAAGLERIASGQDELDRVFGSGIVPGWGAPLGGHPGMDRCSP